MKFFFAVMGGNLAPQDRKTSREQCFTLFGKANENKRRFPGRCPTPRVVWSVRSKLMHKGIAFVRRPFEKAGETFRLLDASVGAAARKAPGFKVLRGCTRTPFRIMHCDLFSDHRHAFALVLKL